MLRRVFALYTSPVLRKIYQVVYISTMFVTCLIRTFSHPSVQLRYVERFMEPVARISDAVYGWTVVRVLALWQPVSQFVATGLKRLASMF